MDKLWLFIPAMRDLSCWKDMSLDAIRLAVDAIEPGTDTQEHLAMHCKQDGERYVVRLEHTASLKDRSIGETAVKSALK